MTEHPETRASMVDVSAKDLTERRAVAACTVRMSVTTRELVTGGELAKGDALEIARIAGIMGAKRTSDLIPLCHPIAIGGIEVTLEPVDEGIAVTAEVVTVERTGVEMEALVAATTAALTVYDMVKSVERAVEITGIRLIAKSGGRSGTWRRDAAPGG